MLKWVIEVGLPTVLIETLWNVKFFVDLWGETEGGSINRNIVECKDMRKSGLLGYPVSINRNIVECKERRAESGERRRLWY